LTIEGNFRSNYEYVLNNGMGIVASVKKNLKGFGIVITDNLDTGLVIAIIWAIDCFIGFD